MPPIAFFERSSRNAEKLWVNMVCAIGDWKQGTRVVIFRNFCDDRGNRLYLRYWLQEAVSHALYRLDKARIIRRISQHAPKITQRRFKIRVKIHEGVRRPQRID